MRVYSVFSSIQGESSRAGLPCTFVRLAGCSIGCSYCDTKNAADPSRGRHLDIARLLEEVRKKGNGLVEVTGGEPLEQGRTLDLLKSLCAEGYDVLLETSGAFSIENIDERVTVIMDQKCPSSGVVSKMVRGNLEKIKKRRKRGEVKFVIKNRTDFDFACDVCTGTDLIGNVEILFAPVWGELEPKRLAQWILDSKIEARLQIQLHKVLWPEGEEEKEI